MIARRRQVALALTAVLAAAAGLPEPGPRGRGARPGPRRAAAPAASPSSPPATSCRTPRSSTGARFDAGGIGYDFRPMLAGIAPVVSRADLALCHMETVYGANGDYTGYPAFKSPPEVADGLAATGYDGCSTASNHTLDDGAAASGAPWTPSTAPACGTREPRAPRPRRTAHPAARRAAPASPTSPTPTTPTATRCRQGQPWAVNLIDEDRILADARAARKAGADVVVVSVHWGTEWQDEPGRAAADAGRELTASRTERPPRHRPDPRHPRPCPAGLREGQRHVGRLRHGRPDRRRDVQPPGRPGPARQRVHRRPLHLRPARPAGGPLGGDARPSSCRRCSTSTPGRVVDLNAALAQGAGVPGVRDRIRDVVLSRGAAKDGLMMGRVARARSPGTRPEPRVTGPERRSAGPTAGYGTTVTGQRPAFTSRTATDPRSGARPARRRRPPPRPPSARPPPSPDRRRDRRGRCGTPSARRISPESARWPRGSAATSSSATASVVSATGAPSAAPAVMHRLHVDHGEQRVLAAGQPAGVGRRAQRGVRSVHPDEDDLGAVGTSLELVRGLLFRVLCPSAARGYRMSAATARQVPPDRRPRGDGRHGADGRRGVPTVGA